MANFNKIILAGNLTRDLELKHSQAGLSVTKSPIAVNSQYKDKKNTMFVDLVFFGKMAETASLYLKKGSPLLIEGRLSLSEWEDDGKKRQKHEVIVDSMEFLGSRDTASAPSKSAPKFEAQEDDEDIPF